MNSTMKNYAPPSLAPILLSDQQYQDLKAKYPGIYEEEISKLSEHIASTGKSYRSHYATLLKWCREDAPKSELDEEARIDRIKAKYQAKIDDLIRKGKQWKSEGRSAEDLQNLKYEIIAIKDSLSRLETRR